MLDGDKLPIPFLFVNPLDLVLSQLRVGSHMKWPKVAALFSRDMLTQGKHPLWLAHCM